MKKKNKKLKQKQKQKGNKIENDKEKENQIENKEENNKNEVKIPSHTPFSLTELPGGAKIKKVKKKKTITDITKVTPKEYELLTDIQLRELIQLKQNKCKDFTFENEKLKNELNNILKDLNKLILNNQKILYYFDSEKDEEMVEKLNQIILLRKRELELSKKNNISSKNQYKNLKKNLNNFPSIQNEKFNKEQINIEKIIEENQILSNKISEINEQLIKQKKELISININQKYPKKINNFTNKMTNLNSFKYQYYNKFKLINKSLDAEKKNLISLEEKINKLNDNNNNIENKENIFEIFNLIKEDLKGTNEEIFKRVEQNKSKIIENFEKKFYLKNCNKVIDLRNKSLLRSNSTIIKSINKSEKIIPKNYKSIFSKYKLLTNNIKYNNNNKSSINIFNINLNNDYENSSDNSYRELLEKKENYIEMNSRLNKILISKQKIFDKKYKNFYNSIQIKKEKLILLKQQNLLYQNEVDELKKLLELTKQQQTLKNDIFLNKHTNQINTIPFQTSNNDYSITKNEIINELNIIKEEEDKKSLFNSFGENNINLNLKSNNINYLKDLNNEEKYERELKLKKIKDKYEKEINIFS